MVGARFIEIDRANQAKLERVIAGGDSRLAPQIDLSGLRDLAEAPSTGGRLRRLLRRAI